MNQEEKNYTYLKFNDDSYKQLSTETTIKLSKIIKSLLFILSVSTLLSVTSCFFIDNKQSPSQHQWSYSQQHQWQHLGHKQCDKKAQSPIDIQRKYVIQNNQLKLHFYNYNQPTRFKIQNAHHTIVLNPIEALRRDQFGLKLQPPLNENGDGSNSTIPDILSAADDDMEPEFVSANHQEHSNRHHQSRIPIESKASNNNHQHQQLNPSGQIGHHQGEHNSLEETSETQSQVNSNEALPYDGVPTIKLDWLDDGNNEYKLRDIHFHWGDRRDNGSEHAIDGRRAAMEMHLVHIKHGLDKSKIGFTSDSVAVIAILVESLRKSNADFNPIVNALTRINMTDQSQEIEYKSINDLLPNILTTFYTYSGSLTTPPCYQVVNWIVMSDRLYLNAKQIEMFRNLYAPSSGETHSPGDGSGSGGEMEPALIMPNIRHIQPLNNRTILASFAPLSRLEQIQVATGHSAYSGAPESIMNITNRLQVWLLAWLISALAASCCTINIFAFS